MKKNKGHRPFISSDFLGRIGAIFKAACACKVEEGIEKFNFVEFTSR